jgi:eukaryotic-like serine/threonine-protein kinase
MSAGTASGQTTVDIACPPDGELKRLIDGTLTGQRQDAVTNHVGDCTACQGRMELLATGTEHLALSSTLRNIDHHTPPDKSKVWKSIDQVVFEVTRTFQAPPVTNGAKSKPRIPLATEDELSFLTKTSEPGKIGRLGEFQVVRMIGRGGMGVVLHAFDSVLERDVALKVLSPELSSNQTARQRFCREARAAAAVTHDHIVAVHAVNEDEESGLPYIVMQLVNGESLEQRLRRTGKLSVQETVRLIAQAASGLQAAHATGLIHRDIKPGNMLIEADGRVKLTDFGLARAHEDLKLTKTGYVSGTPLYMAPEQARGDETDARADLFSLGVVLYEALAGRPPFEGKTPLAVLRRVADDAHEPLSKLNPNVPEWLEDVVDSLLSKEPKDRISTAAELTKVLRGHMSHSSLQQCDKVEEATCVLSPAQLHSNTAKKRYRRRLVTMITVPLALGMLLGATLMTGAYPYFWPNRNIPTTQGETTSGPGETKLDTPLNVYKSDSGAVWSTDTCADGKTIAVGLEDGQIRLFDQTDGSIIASLAGHKGPVWCIDFNTDRNRFASASDDATVAIWDVSKKEKINIIGFDSAVRSVAFTPELVQKGTFIAVGERNGEVHIVNAETKDRLFDANHGSAVLGVATAMYDKKLLLASVGSDKIVRVWDTSSKQLKPIHVLPGHTGPIYTVAFSATGELLATAGWDGEIRIWDLKNGTLLKKLIGHEHDVWSLSFDDCEGLLASAGQDGTVRIWDIAAGEAVQTIHAHKTVCHVVRFSPDGKHVYSGGRDGLVKKWAVNPKPGS